MQFPGNSLDPGARAKCIKKLVMLVMLHISPHRICMHENGGVRALIQGVQASFALPKTLPRPGFKPTSFWSTFVVNERSQVQIPSDPKKSIFSYTNYSKSQIFVQKFSFDKTLTFPRVFHPTFFWQFFSWNQSCQQLKSPKPQHFHEFFTQ